MRVKMQEYLVRKWIIMRMAAQEFYFHEPFDLVAEYTIMKSVLVAAILPIEAVFIFTYARIYGTLHNPLLVVGLAVLISVVVANLTVNRIKDKPLIDEVISEYEQMDYDARKSLYSFKNIAFIVFLTAGLPCLISAAAIALICFFVPR